MSARDELVAAIAGRYAEGDRSERGRILDEFSAVTGFHRKHAMRLLRAGQGNRRSGPRSARRVYDDAVREALIVVWETSDRICGKRLRPLIPVLVEAMERHGHLRLVPEVRTRLLAISAATIDRVLRDIRQRAETSPRRRSAPSAAIRRSVPVRTFAGWEDPPPGFVEADLVAHSGPVTKGSFVHTLVLTDIATGWTECAPLLVREQRLLTEAATAVRHHAHLRKHAIDRLRTDGQQQSANRLVNRQLTVPLQSRQQHRNDWLQPLRAEPVRSLPKHDQSLLDLYPIPPMDAPLHRRAIADLWPQQPDYVLPVIARDRDKLVENLRPLGPTARSVPIPDSRHQLGFRGHADRPIPRYLRVPPSVASLLRQRT